MPEFEVGDRVVSMPSKTECVITEINLKTAYPIIVHYLDGRFEGGYTLEGFRHKDTSPESKKFFIAINYPTGNAKPNNNYWTTIRANSAFIQLSHPELQDILVPISTIKCIDILEGEPTVVSTNYKLPLGPVSIKSVADLLFSNQTNSI